MSESFQQIWQWFSGSPLRILLVIAGALFTQYFGGRAIDRAMTRLATADLVPGPTNTVSRQKERARTTGTVLSSTLNAIIWVLAVAMILGEFGFNLGPIIASAGVIGVALGLGAQTLVRDKYGVGDSVDVLDVKGTVEKVGLRITTIRDTQGTLWYLRNGEILKVGNLSQSG